MMKRVRKGFTLVELLIVIAVLGSLSGMMMQASSDAVDSADAAKILSNLQSLKVAAMEMYIEEPAVAALTEIKLDGTTTVGTETNAPTVVSYLSKYLGKKADAFTSSGAASKYGLVGDTTSWYVVYTFSPTDDNAAVKAKLAARAKEADLYGGASGATTAFTDYYANNNETHIALKVR